MFICDISPKREKRNDSLTQFLLHLSFQLLRLGRAGDNSAVPSLELRCDSRPTSVWGPCTACSQDRPGWSGIWCHGCCLAYNAVTPPQIHRELKISEAENLFHLPAAVCTVIDSRCGEGVILSGMLLGGVRAFKMGHSGMSLGPGDLPSKRSWTFPPPFFCIPAVLCGPEKDLWQIYGSCALGFK